MADDLTRPYIGYRSAGRRPERQQDRRASADAPLAALRGMISGVAGAPGDIESLVRMLPGLSEQTVLPTSEDIERRLPLRGVSETPVGRAFTTAGQLGGGFYTGPGSPLRAIAALPSAVSRAGREFAVAAGQPAVNVVKPKGGNWLAGSAEHALKPMRQFVREPAYMERLALDEAQGLMQPGTVENVANQNARAESVNRWLESKLAKYIRNEMATPEDPLRAMAESWPARQQELLAAKDVQIAKARADMEAARAARGFTPEMMTSSQARIRELEKERELIEARGALHIPTAELERAGQWIPENLGPRRKSAGFPEEGLATTPAGQGWELIADEAIHNMPARMRVSPDTGGGSTKALQVEQENPWLLKVPPETMTYGVYPVEVRSELAFSHLADELRNALNPQSGLPPDLLLKYADLEKKTVPDIVNQVADINAWRAVQKAEADMARASNVATHVFKEYPESPQGFRWVELRQPKKTGKKTTVERSELDEFGMGVDDATLREVAEEMAFDEGLEEGTQAFDDFVNATIRAHNTKRPVEVDESVKALEDALKYEGEVLQHCVGGYCPDVVEGRSRIFSLRDEAGKPYVTIETTPSSSNTIKSLKEGSPQIFDIAQIKGKKNQAPASEYLPYVQDFVRSGQWGRVGDLGNAGLVEFTERVQHIPKGLTGVIPKFKESGITPGYYREDELADLIRSWQSGGETGLTSGARGEGFAEGGLVGGANFPTYDFDPARIDSIVGELHAMNAG